jgi:predicted nucleic-acid-binding protein
MIAVDTNVLVRLLVDDSDSQAQIDSAKTLLKRAKQVYVSQIVQVEMVWVLETAYQFDKLAVLTALKHLQQTALFVLQHKKQFDTALATFEKHTADFSDTLILSNCLENEHQLFTFDKKFARLQSVTLLNEKLLA